jgi:predicted peptidase
VREFPIFLAAFVAPLLVALKADTEPASYLPREIGASVEVPATANRGYLFLRPKLTADAAARLPLVVYLHGAGAKGSENRKPAEEALPKLLATEAVQARFPCFVLVPQCRDGKDALGRPNNWVKWVGQAENLPAQWEQSEPEPSDQLRGAMAALADVLAREPVDRARVYLTGVSMGGSASWYWAAREPERFAAVITACGLSEASKAPQLARVPIWAFHGSDDPVAPVERSRRTVEALQAAEGAVQFTEFTGEGHNIAGRVFEANDHAALRWLFEQRRSR